MAEEKRISRRELLKLLAATGGAIAGSSILPNKWTRPLVETGVLPAHAQISELPTPTPEPSAPLTIRASWEMSQIPIDVDLWVYDPGDGGFLVTGQDPNGPTATHSGDSSNTTPRRNWEEVTVPEGGAADGSYHIYLFNVENEPIDVTLEITAAGSRTVVVRVPGIDTENVGYVEYPGGVIRIY